MKIYKSQKSNSIYILIVSFIFLIFFLMKNTPTLKGDIEQSLRIFSKQPILLKSEKIKENTIHD